MSAFTLKLAASGVLPDDRVVGITRLFSFSSNLMATGRLSHDEGVDEANNATQVLLLQEFQVRILHTLHNECCASAYIYTLHGFVPTNFACSTRTSQEKIFPLHDVQSVKGTTCAFGEGRGSFLGSFMLSSSMWCDLCASPLKTCKKENDSNANSVTSLNNQTKIRQKNEIKLGLVFHFLSCSHICCTTLYSTFL